jgi:hypothetical protein
MARGAGRFRQEQFVAAVGIAALEQRFTKGGRSVAAAFGRVAAMASSESPRRRRTVRFIGKGDYTTITKLQKEIAEMTRGYAIWELSS